MSENRIKQLDCLKLTLKKEFFDQVVSGEKKIEYRDPSDWIMSRLRGQTYKTILFINGYGSDKPRVLTEYKGYNVCEYDVEIYIGEILKTENIK